MPHELIRKEKLTGGAQRVGDLFWPLVAEYKPRVVVLDCSAIPDLEYPLDRPRRLMVIRLDARRGWINNLAMGRNSPSLTEQAISILRQFVESGGHSLIYHDYGQGQIAFQVDNICTIVFAEGEFIQDDLDQLTSLDFLRLE